MGQINQVKRQIEAAFTNVKYPGESDLRNSNEGVEPFLLEEAFRGKDDWTVLEPQFIDLAPDGFASALSFFSPAAFYFYLPAYLIADLEGELDHADPVFYLTHGFTQASKDVPVNPNRYGDYTWFDYVSERFAGFSRDQAAAIVAYLKIKEAEAFTDYESGIIIEALENYWLERSRC